MNPEIPPYQQGSTGGVVNRAQETRRDNDNVKIPEITPYDIDYAIFYHLSQNLNVQINDNGNLIPIPVMFSTAEKWSQIRQHGYIRDNEKKAMAPVMILKRNSITADDRFNFGGGNLFSPVTTFTPNIRLIPYRTLNMQYDRQAGQLQTKASYEYYALSVPNYVKVNYELLIWTDLMEQMNHIIAQLVAIDNHIWGDYHKFRTQVLDITSNNINAPGDDRLVRSTVNLEVDGYLRSAFEYKQSNLVKQYSIKRVDFGKEVSEQEYFTMVDELSPDQLSHFTNEPILDQTNNLKRNIRY